MRYNGSILRGKENKVGALFDSVLDCCPVCEGAKCVEAEKQNRVFPCTGGQFQSCNVYMRLKREGQL